MTPVSPATAPHPLEVPRRGRGLRRHRLRGVGAFESLFRAGRRRDGAWLQVVSVAAQHPPGRVGYVIGKKALPRAVDRNRLRRMLRETMRQARPAIEAYDLIVRLKRDCAPSEFANVNAEAVALLTGLTGRVLAASAQ